jgi:hypothetical protein
MIEFAIVTVKTGASVTHWVRYSSIISNSMAESVTNASFVLGADQREGSNVLIVAHLLSVHSHRISLQLLQQYNQIVHALSMFISKTVFLLLS